MEPLGVVGTGRGRRRRSNHCGRSLSATSRPLLRRGSVRRPVLLFRELQRGPARNMRSKLSLIRLAHRLLHDLLWREATLVPTRGKQARRLRARRRQGRHTDDESAETNSGDHIVEAAMMHARELTFALAASATLVVPALADDLDCRWFFPAIDRTLPVRCDEEVTPNTPPAPQQVRTERETCSDSRSPR